jgi:protoporphyrinogen IX oxidase
MPWLKLLHISAVIVWCGALLYLPGLIVATLSREAGAASPATRAQLLRPVYTHVATPAALLAIASGTAIFVWHDLLAVWLMAKLALVGLLVLGHGACGLLVLRAEAGASRGTRLAAWLIVSSSLLWLLAIAWLVLQKPV